MVRRISWACAMIGAMGACYALAAAPATQPRWIWHAQPSPAPARNAKVVEACFRRTVMIPDGAKVSTALLALTADATVCRVYVNGTALGEKRSDWRSVWGVKIAKHLRPGKNVVAIVAAKPPGGWAGLVGRMTVNFEAGPPLVIVTDQQWKMSLENRPQWTSDSFDDSAWPAAREVGPLGMAPNVAGAAREALQAAARDADPAVAAAARQALVHLGRDTSRPAGGGPGTRSAPPAQESVTP